MKVLIASHGYFSIGCLDTIKMIMGEDFTRNITTYSLMQGENPNDYVNKIKDKLDENEEYVIFTDLFGGSVFNAFSSLANSKNIFVVAGTNINVLIEFMLSAEEDVEQRIEKSIENAKNGLMLFNNTAIEEENEEF